MPSKAGLGVDVVIALAVAIVLVGLCIIVGDTSVGIAFAFLIMPLLFYAASRVPLRQSLMVMMWLALVLPNPSEGIMTGKDWTPPFMSLGAILLCHINIFDRSSSLLSLCSFSGFDICFLALGGIAWWRKATGSTIDSNGRVPTPYPMLQLAWLSLATTGFVWVYGIVTGGNIKESLWQLNAAMYIPIVFLLFHVGLRGPVDHLPLAKVLLSAAVYKSFLAVWVWDNIHEPADSYGYIMRVAYATCHADSILFADACLLIIALLLERQKVKGWALILLPIYVAGMAANNRRLVWVQILLVLFTVYIISKDNPAKRFIRKALIFSSPAFVIYLMVGWNSTSGGLTFKPVRILRSVIDSKSDASSFWRELENFNLLTDWMNHPIFGSGYGHPYNEYVAMPEVGYTLEHYVPHNSILALWAFCGLVGYAGFTMFWNGGVYFAMRGYYAATRGTDRAAALVSFGSVLVWLMMCFGDLGLGLWAGVFTVAPAFALSGKLAVSLGEWSAKPKP